MPKFFLAIAAAAALVTQVSLAVPVSPSISALEVVKRGFNYHNGCEYPYYGEHENEHEIEYKHKSLNANINYEEDHAYEKFEDFNFHHIGSKFEDFDFHQPGLKFGEDLIKRSFGCEDYDCDYYYIQPYPYYHGKPAYYKARVKHYDQKKLDHESVEATLKVSDDEYHETDAETNKDKEYVKKNMIIK
ncbi:hypothetical protein BC938DRAFT_481443 [Jimgerdemannia flammicorona]|uniref:Uncharacterized protein n=1 Tax=Jimgerdemannia flammicorona TaxID=994334 RepID=A0A433QG76_9FUNG|nr:hypothetical protein BC938DRAFT_481443 [Jimgerdemannia flammicorona]